MSRSLSLPVLVASVLAVGCAQAPDRDRFDPTDADAPLFDGEEPWADDVDGPLPPPLPQGMVLNADPLVPGDTALLSATGASPGDTVAFLRGDFPGAACPPQLGGGCLDIDNPSLLGTAVADGTGEAILPLSLPLSVPVGVSTDLQAVVGSAGIVSDVVSATTEAVCGDLLLQSSEGCDDGNTDTDDGCSEVCELEVCGDSIVQAIEECDDGNTVPGDGCSDQCIAELTDDFDIAVVDATLFQTNPATNDDWDFDPLGIWVDPDVYYLAWVDNTLVYTSNVASDDRTPTFNDVFAVTVTPGSTLYLDFWDEDTLGSDYVGTLQFDHDDLNQLIDTGSFTAGGGGIRTATLEVMTP